MITVLGFRKGWLRFLKGNFGHIDVYQVIKGNWILLNLTFNHLWVNGVDQIDTAFYKKILIVESKAEKGTRVGFFPFSCVKLAAYIIGIHPWCLTPYGLYRSILYGRHKNITNVEVI